MDQQFSRIRRYAGRPAIPNWNADRRADRSSADCYSQLDGRVEEMTIAAGTKLGRYEIRSQIGAGGMGEVYLALDAELDRTVAIKIIIDVLLPN